MKNEVQEMANRLRNNQEANLRDYEKQYQKSEKRIMDIEKLAQENFLSTVELREKHLKAK